MSGPGSDQNFESPAINSLLDGLARYRSDVPKIDHRPDPIVLGWVVSDMRAVAAEAGRQRVPEDFLRRLVEHFVECFREMDRLPRDDPFWAGTNKRPTRYKMDDFCHQVMSGRPDDPLWLWRLVAVQVLSRHFFDPHVWRKLVDVARPSAGGAVYAAFMGLALGGYDTAEEIGRFLIEHGLCIEARTALDQLDRSGMTIWVARVKAWCD